MVIDRKVWHNWALLLLPGMGVGKIWDFLMLVPGHLIGCPINTPPRYLLSGLLNATIFPVNFIPRYF